MKRNLILMIMGLLAACSLSAQVMPEQKSRLTVGGYGEITFSRNFYSDNVYRYSHPADYKSDPGHARFDVPHAVIFLGYDFGRGWTMQTEIEFEHGGTGTAVEKEYTEAGEWESEIEKGGEVALEQLWLQKSFAPQFNVRIGHIVVPVGGLNNAHEPLNFFTVFRPEGESTILPSTWHDTGLSLWGEAGKWRYEALVVAGLDAFMFDRDNFIKHGAGSPYEYKVANNLGFAARVDNFSVKDLRLSLSGFYGQAMHNSYPNDMWNTRYADVKGHTLVGAFDFAYTGKYLTVRGNADWGYVSDAQVISTVKRNLSSNDAPYKKTPVGRNAVAAGLEAGYDFLHLFSRGRDAEQKLYLFGRYEYYDSYIPAADQPDYPYTDRHRMAVGLNWLPIPQVALKCEYSRRFLKSQYNGEPSLSLGIVYMGFFNR
ncbi:hypothetical protein SAMN06298214_1703 [Bacteroidales bacterium WCE2004]|nr:hypothetical protein SAMN06298214_1703 [Bacteroidales bacterium WCE2004]